MGFTEYEIQGMQGNLVLDQGLKGSTAIKIINKCSEVDLTTILSGGHHRLLALIIGAVRG